uniref:condensation domain-containing protein n=1 Tax=unclassified Bradyrhizobium TaxID=2631580 RepID=UPI0028E196CA
QAVPFERIVQEVQPARDLSRHPLFQVELNCLSIERDLTPTTELSGDHALLLRPERFDAQRSRFDLTVYLQPDSDGYLGTAEYATSIFDAATIDRLLAHLVSVADVAAQHPNERLSTLPLVYGTEEQELLTSWAFHEARTDVVVV